ncbi:Arsenical resistance operon repressor [Pelotomaculum schinkii]|uniref:Arsenical resistance operon repressor n=1 Tax=Pelotomaculum schinkii TaxID=78350 RepID=A0A4Y7RGE4_9FIRM|nr:metalloregulator ArsR/SmtB family transcription factor [Pelotomaculum schinkii]TEB07387.1 Arsenical resistance operon repressor [Pelotomaculum schinkii]
MINPEIIARALGDPIRYNIMKILARSESGCCALPGSEGSRPGLCNCELMAELGMIQSRVSYHMKELTEAGLVTEEPRGRWKFYSINSKTLQQFVQQLYQDLMLE